MINKSCVFTLCLLTAFLLELSALSPLLCVWHPPCYFSSNYILYFIGPSKFV